MQQNDFFFGMLCKKSDELKLKWDRHPTPPKKKQQYEIDGLTVREVLNTTGFIEKLHCWWFKHRVV